MNIVARCGICLACTLVSFVLMILAGSLLSFLWEDTKEPTCGRHYCQPDQDCWPTEEAINEFKKSLSEPDADCLPHFSTFTSRDSYQSLLSNMWFPDLKSIMTPYELLNLRNHLSDTLAHFVVLARNKMDVSKAVRFAAKHELALTVFGTGHDYQDRNAICSPFGLLIRTICLRQVEVDLNPNNTFGHEDGVIRLGSGMTWGNSTFGFKGATEIALEHDRVLVTASASSVGIVGWSMGGGHGPLAPLYGLGVDQMLQVELVGPDGSYITANSQGTKIVSHDGSKTENLEDNSLFWAMRGGGAGPWGAVTAMTLKLHDPSKHCPETYCFNVESYAWRAPMTDGGQMAKDLLLAFFNWTTQVSDQWSGNFVLNWDFDDTYTVRLQDFLYFGSLFDFEEKNKAFKFFKPLYELQADEMYALVNFKNYHEYLTYQEDQETKSVKDEMSLGTSLFLSKKILDEKAGELVDNLIDQCWAMRCTTEGLCNSQLKFHFTLPRIDENHKTNEEKTSISKDFREAFLHVSTGLTYSKVFDEVLGNKNATEFVQQVLSPAIYKFGRGSYYSDSEYTMKDWQARYWDPETYDKLVNIKQQWDPEHVFACRHCIGHEEMVEEVDSQTLPSWRHFEL